MGHVCDAGGYPTVRASIVSAACVKIHRRTAKGAAPNDHLASRPDCGVRTPRRGRVGNAGGDPTIRTWVISAASIAIVKRGIDATPDNHFATGPYRGVTIPPQHVIRDAGGRPTVRAGIISAAGV